MEIYVFCTKTLVQRAYSGLQRPGTCAWYASMVPLTETVIAHALSLLLLGGRTCPLQRSLHDRADVREIVVRRFRPMVLALPIKRTAHAVQHTIEPKGEDCHAGPGANPQDESAWSAPRLVAKVGEEAHWNPVLFRGHEGRIWMHFKVGVGQ